MLVVDRASFRAWIDGVLLERDSAGRVVVGDTIGNRQAEEAVYGGSIVGLTVGGRIVSTLRLVDGVATEELFDAAVGNAIKS